MTLESLHDDHTARFACIRAVRNNNQFRRSSGQAQANGAAIARPLIADQTWEN